MKNEKLSRAILSVIIILIVCIGVAVYIFNVKLSKEENSAKEFLEMLYNKDMIDSNIDIDKVKFEVVKEFDGDKEYYRVTSKEFGFDIDSDYRVVGFNYNYNITSVEGVSMSSETARNMAEVYISELVNEDYKYKDTIKEVEDENLSYYGYIFTRYKDGYPFYSDQIMIQIDKYSGYLSGYSNTASQGNPEKIENNIEKQEAETIAVALFNKLNVNGIVNEEETYSAFCDNKEKTKTELCYVVTVTGLDIDNKEMKIKYFISHKDGEIINFIKDTVSKTIA